MTPLVRIIFNLSFVFFWILHLNRKHIALTIFHVKSTFFPSSKKGSTFDVTWNFTVTKPSSASKPNVILILADDLGINDLYGDHFQLTSNIRSIASSGVKFDTAYSGHATCAPARAALLTGRLPTRFGFEFTPVPPIFAQILAESANSLNASQKKEYTSIFHASLAREVPRLDDMKVPVSETFFPEVLQQNGYRTFFFGKWHLGSLPTSDRLG